MAPFTAQPEPATLEVAKPGEGREIPLLREELVVLRAPSSHAAEQFRRFRNSLLALNPDGAARSILMTSAAEHEGKSVAAINLALSLVELSNLRLCLVDCDRLNPSIEDYLGHPRRQGLTELLQGAITIDQGIRPTAVERFDLIGAGASSQNPGLDLERLQALLNALKRRYDYVLLDGPAVLTTNHPSLIGSVVDGILLVVRIGATPKGLVEEAYQMLEGLGGNVLGTCATAVDGPIT
ncbi:MAG: CpsD/CapB family tyrosine-protein kinase [Planctomycetes bacterium]|nr:CpsD/CapB family tyrosine-protein kinase [Planctomycetota bacterium]